MLLVTLFARLAWVLNNVATLRGKPIKLGIGELLEECLQKAGCFGRYQLFSIFCIISSEIDVKTIMLLTTVQN